VNNVPNLSAIPAAGARTPLHVGAVGLKVRDLDRLTAYYCGVLGLEVCKRAGNVAMLGVGEVPLLELIQNADALPDDPREAGLYHTAFLMPTRGDLARWILHAASSRVPITGAADHDVSEAIYLDDPEGNGIEVYSDRPPERWRRDGKTIFQKTDPLDIEAIVGEVNPAAATYPTAPVGLRIGHIHLRVGNVAEAEAFYCGALGLEVTRRRSGATFIAAGGYHHHVGANVWHSEGASKRTGERTGLDWFSLEAVDQPTMEGLKKNMDAAGEKIEAVQGGFAAADPWGTRIRFAIAA